LPASFFHARRVRNVSDHLGLGSAAYLFLDLHANRLEIQTHLLQHVHGDTLPQLNQAEQKVFGSDVVVVKAIRFLARKGEDLLRSGREVIHHRGGVTVFTVGKL